MKRIVSALVLLVTIFTVLFATPAIAADLTLGAKVFNSNCAACHAGGSNAVVAPKTLKTKALADNKMDSADAIIAQVRNGKNIMPAFKTKLTDEQIEAVAAYVLDQAGKNWAKG